MQAKDTTNLVRMWCWSDVTKVDEGLGLDIWDWVYNEECVHTCSLYIRSVSSAHLISYFT